MITVMEVQDTPTSQEMDLTAPTTHYRQVITLTPFQVLALLISQLTTPKHSERSKLELRMSQLITLSKLVDIHALFFNIYIRFYT